MQTQLPIILASTSPRRRELLQTLGLPFTVQASNADETVAEGLTPAQIVEELSLRKAKATAATLKQGLVIGSDTIVVLDGQVLGKPADQREAFRMLASLQGREHFVYSGVAMVDAKTNQVEVAHSMTKVFIRSLTEREITAYINTGEPMDKAGSYAIQGLGATLVEGIVGDYFTVVGLPLQLTARLLTRFGIFLL